MDKIFSTRSKCIFCNSDNLYNLLEKDYKCSVSLTMMKNEEETLENRLNECPIT